MALFQRPVMQFPPPGIDSRDSYFAVEADPASKGTRRYLGLMAPGKSQTTLLVRTEELIIDPAWTVAEVSLEDIVLAHMRRPAVDAELSRIGR